MTSDAAERDWERQQERRPGGPADSELNEDNVELDLVRAFRGDALLMLLESAARLARAHPTLTVYRVADLALARSPK